MTEDNAAGNMEDAILDACAEYNPYPEKHMRWEEHDGMAVLVDQRTGVGQMFVPLDHFRQLVRALRGGEL